MVLQFENVGVDIKNEPIEVAPTAHHFMGGIKINTDASTSIPNLFACGEVCGGVHGANRLGGNALADTQVFGKIAGESAAEIAKNTELKSNEEMFLAEKSRIEGLIKPGSIKALDIIYRYWAWLRKNNNEVWLSLGTFVSAAGGGRSEQKGVAVT